MGVKRLPRDPEQQKLWARRLASSLSVVPLACFRCSQHEPISSYYHKMLRCGYEIGARAALDEVLKELERSDDPYEGLPPHLVKSAKAAAAARKRKAEAAGSRRSAPQRIAGKAAARCPRSEAAA